MNSFIIISLFLVLVGCASKQSQSIVFPDLPVGACPDGSDRSPSNLCGSKTGNEKYKQWESVLNKFDKHMEQVDGSKGKGFTSAALYLAGEKEPIRQKSSDSVFRNTEQIVSFYQKKSPFGDYNRGGSAVQGTPTRIYLTYDGKIAYMAFDEQPVNLLEYTAYMNTFSYSKIPGQGAQQHPTGFSAPVGKIKKLADHISQYKVDELKMFLGKEGDEVTIEFESGVVVKGVIDKYSTLTNSADDQRAVVITFANKTTTVTYGVHTLFRPSWGVFDMLLMPEVSDSNASLRSTP